ncbi:hypothetical protein [Streptomyces sp. NPDC006856]|uniref:hypothetical protein n=1 Tax=Streptomyces sp. NPDC006856 TaxID=3364766 RepID=UPI0036A6F6F7
MTQQAQWDAKEDPWIRRPEAGHPEKLPCYFCGGFTAKRSYSDRSEDPSRIELYCDNQFCDAREFVILTLRNGGDAHERTDVRALRQVDRGSTPPKDLDITQRQQHVKDVVRRRQNPRSVIVVTEADGDGS